MTAEPLHEMVFELLVGAGSVDPTEDSPVAALLRLPGVVEAHVDDHRTWAMVSFAPSRTSLASIVTCLMAQGLVPSQVRRLMTDSDPCE